MNLINFAFVTLLVAGPLHAGEVTPFKTLTNYEALRKILVDHSELRDPFTVQFRNVYVRENPWRVYTRRGRGPKCGEYKDYCGELNAKNGFGAYSGWSRFYAQENPLALPSKPAPMYLSFADESLIFSIFCKDAPISK